MLKMYNNEVFFDLTLSADENLAIVAGTPERLDTNVILDPGAVLKNCSYALATGITIGAGVASQYIEFDFSCSLSSSVQNRLVTAWIYKNGTPQLQKTLRKIGTANDVGSAGFVGGIPIAANDVIDVYFDTDADTTITIKEGHGFKGKTKYLL